MDHLDERRLSSTPPRLLRCVDVATSLQQGAVALIEQVLELEDPVDPELDAPVLPHRDTGLRPMYRSTHLCLGHRMPGSTNRRPKHPSPLRPPNA